MHEIQNDYESCPYCKTVRYEYDTGYAAYECLLFGGGCIDEEDCPLTCKYEVL
jgi:hypothetical protein